MVTSQDFQGLDKEASPHADLSILMVIGLMPHGHFLFPNPLSELAVRERDCPDGPSRSLFLKYPTQVVQEP
ncbi:hypothetical protein NE659_27645, partial [Flavonifractor plautii]|uniref:hypothetical protein n=1 Tax=Flavonifractor plautii TaxID=292800 RepID=UPI002108AB94